MVSSDSGKLAPWTAPGSQDTEPPRLLRGGEWDAREERGGAVGKVTGREGGRGEERGSGKGNGVRGRKGEVQWGRRQRGEGRQGKEGGRGEERKGR